MQYIGRAETAFNLRLNNRRKDTKKPNSILACKHFQEKRQDFNKHSKFIIIDELVNLHGSKEAWREMLVRRENFWIQKLKTLDSFGLNQELIKQKRTFMLLPFRLILASLKQIYIYIYIYININIYIYIYVYIYDYIYIYIYIIHLY